MSIAGFFSITRPVNSVVSGLAAIIAYLIDTGTVIPETVFLFVIVALITAAGNVINDYFDAEIDAINRPDRPIPSGAVSLRAARNFAIVLFITGILVSFFTNFLCIAIAIFNVLLLVAYAARLKGLPLAGNLAVSYLAASVFLFGGALNGWGGLVHILPIAAITFFATLARELVKDAEDIEGDKAGGADTVPIRIGIRKTAIIALVAACLAVSASFIPYTWWGPWYVAAILIVDCIIIGAALRALPCDTPECLKTSKSATLFKAGFFASLLIFAVSAVFLRV
jgi:geranylgeranylglycerol-phosphate geranylgeranyltransferase